jgi:predicted DNA-binding ribbon-helix-helix protein
MKTTIEISDALFRKMKEVAAARGTTLKALVESAIRQSLEQESRPKKRFRLRKHTVRGKGLHPGIREGRWTDIRSLIYEGQGG